MAFSVLFVCIGNVCRSPLAERLMRSQVDAQLGMRRHEVHVSSVGTRALANSPMDEHAAADLDRLGGKSSAFVSRQLTEAHVIGSSLVLAMTKEVRSRVLEEAPDALRRTFTLLEFATLAEGAAAQTPSALVADATVRRSSVELAAYDIADPIGRSPEVHRQVANQIDGAVLSIAIASTRSFG